MTTADATEDPRVYAVVINDEEQYSIWFDDRPLPLGWAKVGVVGTKDTCLNYIEAVWTDMRPKSLRLQMDSRTRQG
nr:mbtH-like protein [uncultured bacterium]